MGEQHTRNASAPVMVQKAKTETNVLALPCHQAGARFAASERADRCAIDPSGWWKPSPSRSTECEVSRRFRRAVSPLEISHAYALAHRLRAKINRHRAPA